MNFGAFMEIIPGKEGLVHVSKIANKRIDNIEEHIKLGEIFTVKVEEIDKQKRLNLSLVDPIKL